MKKVKAAARPALWVLVGWTLCALYILGPRVALNRGLDQGYSLSGWVRSRV